LIDRRHGAQDGPAARHQRRSHQAAARAWRDITVAERDVGDSGDVVVREILELAKHEDLAYATGKAAIAWLISRRSALRSAIVCGSSSAGPGTFLERVVAVVDEGSLSWTVLLQPGGSRHGETICSSHALALSPWNFPM
jgi:hypothetical protein